MPAEAVLAVSLELAGASWKIALHDDKRDKPAIYTVNEQAPVPRLLHAVAVIEALRP
jgi:transposase